LIKFVIDDNTTKKNKKDRETLKMQERQTKEDNLKNLESQIITVKSEIEKNKTALKDAIKYKDFLNNMDAEVAEKKKIEKEQKKEVFKQNWIKRMRNLPPSDS
jgi:dGTP triphosphohydrolase